MPDARIRALEETWAAIAVLLADVRDDEWGLPTPCAEWNVHDLAAHLGAIEGQFQGLPQPEVVPPEPAAGLDGWTAAGVAARRNWSPEEVRAEIAAASAAQLDHLRGLDGDGWQAERLGPLGMTTEESLAGIRTFDLYTHLLDLRTALGRPLGVDPDDAREPTAAAVCARRAFEVTPWGAAKVAKLADGAHIRFDLTGPGGQCVDLVMAGGRARLEPPQGDAADQVTGSAIAYTMAVAGRPQVVEGAGGVRAVGPDAERLMARFRMFG